MKMNRNENFVYCSECLRFDTLNKIMDHCYGFPGIRNARSLKVAPFKKCQDGLWSGVEDYVEEKKEFKRNPNSRTSIFRSRKHKRMQKAVGNSSKILG